MSAAVPDLVSIWESGLPVGDLGEVPAEEAVGICLGLGAAVELLTGVLLKVGELGRVERAARNLGSWQPGRRSAAPPAGRGRCC